MSETKPYNRLRDIRVGLEIFERHGGRFANAEHDILYAGPGEGQLVTPEEETTLEEYGWHFDEEVESWALFT
jgi:hypothetical protein